MGTNKSNRISKKTQGYQEDGVTLKIKIGKRHSSSKTKKKCWEHVSSSFIFGGYGVCFWSVNQSGVFPFLSLFETVTLITQND